MSNRMNIDAAMAQLEAGKFSFQMVDAIKEHVAALASEVEVLRASQADAASEIKRREYAVWRLEAEACKLNARIHALVRANAFSELLCRESAAVSVKLAGYAEVAARAGRAAFARAMADIEAGKPQAELARLHAALLTLIREHAPTEQQIREAVAQIEPYLETAKKRLGPSVEKMAAYLSNMKKNFA